MGDLKSATVSHGSEERVITFTYVNDVRYVEMDDGADRVVNNTTSHNLATVDDALNQIYVQNEYDDQDRVVAQTYGDKTIRYSYTETADGGLSVDITDRRGQTATQVYDNQYHLLSLTDEAGVTYTYSYDTSDTSDQQVSQTTYPDGSTVAYSYNDV